MSKRTERRAAERLAHKAARTQTINAAAAPVSSLLDTGIEDGDDHIHTPAELAEFQTTLAQVTAYLAAAKAPVVDQKAESEAQPEIESESDPYQVTPETIENLKATFATYHRRVEANRANAQLSTGPTSPEGKAIVSQNRRSHGLAGQFVLLPWEHAADHQELTAEVYNEYQPEPGTEQRLADSLIQHYWLMQRAVRYQQQLMIEAGDPDKVDPKRLALFFRYQTTHERSYYKAQRELQNLQKQKRKEQVGFESQNRIQEAHEARVRLSHARALTLEVDANCRQVMEAPIPGTTNIPFEVLTKACADAIGRVVFESQYQTAA